MTRYIAPILLAAVTAIVMSPLDETATAQGTAAVADNSTATVEVVGGTAAFDAGTNIPAINVHGKSTNLQGRASIRLSGGAITIERMEATLLVKTLTTGLGLRDEHMRKHIFTTDDGAVPDLKFASDRAECTPAAGGESTCKVSGQLAIRGTARPFTIALKVSRAGNAYRATGDGATKLSAYGIPQPSQFGVTTTDDVKVHLEFTARPSANQAGQMTANAGGSQ